MMRLESSAGAPRIAPLPNLPLFHKLAGRKAVVCGASAGADWKAELLAAAGADVIRLPGTWVPADLEGAALAVADLSDRNEALRFAGSARSAGAIVNIIDQPELSDVQFGTIVNRAPVVVAISTDGAAPMLGQSIRARIESVLPPGLTAWARAAKEWRPRLKHSLADFADRKRFWERFVTAAWRHNERAPREDDFDRLVRGAPEGAGRVWLVGAGPGDPELLTLKAVRALQTATVILHDRLVGPEILELARREARRIAVGKKGHGVSCSQTEISALMVELAQAGENVVRLKGGDPLIFGRATEEIAACRAAGVEVLVVPGISAAQGAAASLLISLTERKQARRLQLITGHAADGLLPNDLDWRSIADPKSTIAIYMPRSTLGAFVHRAVANGLDPSTPAVAIASATLPGEAYVATTIGNLPAAASELPVEAPVMIIIGWVARELAGASATLLPFARAAS